jgi:hypothetical protein
LEAEVGLSLAVSGHAFGGVDDGVCI